MTNQQEQTDRQFKASLAKFDKAKIALDDRRKTSPLTLALDKLEALIKQSKEGNN